MSEDKIDPPQASADLPAEAVPPSTSEQTIMGLPIDVFVRGGTTTSAHDRAEAELTASAEARRAQADAERRSAAQGQGKLFGGPLVPDAGEQAYVELFYLTAKGEQRYEFGEPMRCLADVVLVGPNELCVVLVCPACKERGVPLDRCQMRVRQSNRAWEFSSKRQGDAIAWVEGVDAHGKKIVKLYRSAGTVVESEKFSCAQCGWAARIADNKVRPER